MEINSLTLKPLDSKLVPAPELGKDAEIRICKLNVAGVLRRNNLVEQINKSGVKGEVQQSQVMAAQLMCSMVKSDGEYLVPEDERVGEIAALFGDELMFRLLKANSELNPVKGLDEEKK